MRIKDAANRIDRLASRSTYAARAAALLRNQANMTIGYHLAPSSDRTTNGEQWLQQTVAPRVQRFIDVGANVGDWSAAMLSTAPTAEGIAVEAGGEAVERLRSRGLPGVTVVHAVAGPTAGIVDFYEQPGAGEWSSLSAAHAVGGIARSVPMVTVDGLLNDRGWDMLDLLKVDAEGSDLGVLHGADRLLSRQRVSVLQFEYSPPWADAGATLKAAISYLSSHGYTVAVLKPSGIERYNYERFGEFFQYSNFVAVTEIGAGWLSCKWM